MLQERCDSQNRVCKDSPRQLVNPLPAVIMDHYCRVAELPEYLVEAY